MKRILALILTAMLLFTAVASPAEEAGPKVETVKERVIKVTYQDFDLDSLIEHELKNLDIGAACTAIKGTLGNGDLYIGRNLDFYCTDSPAFVVEVMPGEKVKNHFIGLGSTPNLPAWEDGKEYVLDEDNLAKMPTLCSDGTNGDIYVEANVRSYEWDENDNNYIVTNHTNPGQPRRMVGNLIMWAVTNYNSIDEVLEHMDDYDWFTFPDGYTLGGAGMDFSVAFFITEKTGKSGIIEFCGDSWHYTPTFFNANFYQNDAYYALEKMPVGEARINTILPVWARIENHGTEQDVRDMMNLITYAQVYRLDNKFDVTSEFYGSTWTTSIGLEVPEEIMNKELVAKNPELVMALIKDRQAETNDKPWDERVEEHFWETSLCTVVNMTRGTIDSVFSEYYAEHFTIDIATGAVTP